MKRGRIFFVIGCLLLLSGCGRKQEFIEVAEKAQYFRLVDTLGIRMADVYNPWKKGEILARYYLTPDSTTPTPSDGVRLQVPLKRIATTSATHIGYLHTLNKTNLVVAMATPELVYNQPMQPIIDIGDDTNLQIEPLLIARPDAILVSSYGQEMQNLTRIQESGIAIVYLTEWMEQNPLARMEWIRLIGALVGAETEADSIVRTVVDTYHRESAFSNSLTSRRTIMSGASFRGTWYVPSGNTYMGRIFHDAGAEYAFADRTTDGSIPLNMEQALQAFGNADVWVGVNARNLQELRTMDEKQTWFHAYQTGEVYNFYRRQTEKGANDFWELGVVHPEIILRDLRYALYPETLPDYSPVFIQQLKQD